MSSSKIDERDLDQSLLNTINEKADQDDLDALQEAINAELEEVKKSASDGKAIVAAAVTNKGVSTSANATYEAIAANINGITTINDVPNRGAATITPGASAQTIAAGQYLTGVQTIAGDADLISANIKAGANIFGVAGNSNVVDTSSGTATAAQILSGAKAWVDGKEITGNMVNVGSASKVVSTLNDSTGALSGNIVNIVNGEANGGQDAATFVEFIPPAGYYDGVNSKINLRFWGITPSRVQANAPIGNVNNPLLTGTYTSDATATAADIISGKIAYSKGNKLVGTAPVQAAKTWTPGTSNQTIAAGTYCSGVQTIAGDTDLVAGNIKKGVNIFGVTGNYDPVANSHASNFSEIIRSTFDGGEVKTFTFSSPVIALGLYRSGSTYIWLPGHAYLYGDGGGNWASSTLTSSLSLSWGICDLVLDASKTSLTVTVKSATSYNWISISAWW